METLGIAAQWEKGYLSFGLISGQDIGFTSDKTQPELSCWAAAQKRIKATTSKWRRDFGRNTMPKKTREYHAWLLGKLATPQTAADYLNGAMNDSPEMFLKALRNVAEARQMATVAKEAGVRRESLYRTLSKRGNPRLDTLNAVLRVLGLRIAIQTEGARSVRRVGRGPSSRIPTKLAPGV